MTIILSSQVSEYSDNVIGNSFGGFAETLGIPGFPDTTSIGRETSDILAIKDKINSVLNKILGKNQEQFDPNYVDSGRKVVIGSGIQGGKGPALEEANLRQNYSQTPQISVIIKKRAFSSLQNLYDPAYMDSSEKWLLRATKRLVSRKCKIMADYERLSKIEKLVDSGNDLSLVFAQLMSSAEESAGNIDNFSSAKEFERVVFARQPVRTTTYFIDPTMPILEELGPGNGVFEITAVASLQTSLGIEGEGSFSVEIEDPYRILFVTEEDIETALNETSLSTTINILDTVAADALNSSQISDSLLSKQRRARGRSEISFTIGLGKSNITAIIDAIGFQINENNLNDIPVEQSLDSTETDLFLSVINNLKIYQQSISKNILGGMNLASAQGELSKQKRYARDKMRMFYLGKSIIQPMDTINIFIDGGTRRVGEGENTENNGNTFTLDNALDFVSKNLENSIGLDETLLFQEWQRAGEFPDFETFKKIRTLSLSTENDTSVFVGFVKSATDSFDAESGSYKLSISGDSNMGWLDVSRYNAQPALDQTQGVVYDPLTPFDIETDPATGLPIGKPKLSEANKKIIAENSLYFSSGPKIGQKLTNENDMKQDMLVIGSNLINLYQHAPGLVYKWKEGIMTVTYNTFTNDPLNTNLPSLSQLRRDTGFFASYTPFDNMDAANVLSVLITGMPYNMATFIQSAINTGSYNLDSTLNSGKDYFHSFLNIQKSIIKTNGNFVPFKSISISPLDLARAIYYQQRISDKSAQLSQLRNQEAKLSDQINNLLHEVGDKALEKSLGVKRAQLNKKIDTLATSLSSLSIDNNDLNKIDILISGNDVSFDLARISNNQDYKLFGDKLIFSTLRRREDVVRNIDKNYFIVSDEYDKDYDIQAFVLRLRDRAPDMWKSTWQSMRQLCKSVAEILDFEFFCNNFGHLVFRPPQYNRMPRSVFEQMLTLNSSGGIKLFPDFITSLFQSRQDALFYEIKTIEWDIRKNASLLGATDDKQISSIIQGNVGSPFYFITDPSQINEAITSEQAINPDEKQRLKQKVSLSLSTQIATPGSLGVFPAFSQLNLQRGFESTNISNVGSQTAYENAINQLVNLNGFQKRNYPEFNQAKVGAIRNGQSTPITDISNLISTISQLVSDRSRLIRALDKVLSQSIEIASISEDGKVSLSKINPPDLNNSSQGILNQMLEDDTTDYLGHMSGERFIIKDENIYRFSFTETPPYLTVCSINGAIPVINEGGGNLGGTPMIKAYGVDFDLWRQYGFRNDKDIDKPFLSNADYQCAPYAVMLLSRQRKNIVTGNVTVVGNEFYQLGDVVYIAHRQMLYYVTKIQHQIDYSGNFSTTLELKYGHPPGQYIPTPLDVIGKMQITKGTNQGSYRIRREQPRTDTLIGTIVFDENSSDMFSGNFSKRNYDQLVNSLVSAQTEIDRANTKTSFRIYCNTFFGGNIQQTRAQKVKSWLSNPVKPGQPGNDFGINGLGGDISNTTSKFGSNSDMSSFRIDHKLVKIQQIHQDNPTIDDLELLSKGIVASQETFALDSKSNGANVVEIRLRQPPIGGWPDE